MDFALKAPTDLRTFVFFAFDNTDREEDQQIEGSF